MVRHSTIHVCIVMGAGHLTSDLYMYVYMYLTLHTTIYVVQYTFPEPSPQREKEGLVTFNLLGSMTCYAPCVAVYIIHVYTCLWNMQITCTCTCSCSLIGLSDIPDHYLIG